MAGRVTTWLRSLAQPGRVVVLGDPGRTYSPAESLREHARYLVPTSRDLEGREIREAVVWEVMAE
jgi:predicted nicotinamide N-methyase